MALEERIEAVHGDMRRDFNRGLSHKEFGGPMFGEYGTFLPVYLRPPSASTRSRVQACPTSKLPCKEESNGDYNARHDLHVLKPGAGEYGHERKSDETTTSSMIPYDHGDCLDDSLAGFTLYEARKLRSAADRLKGHGDDEVEISEIYLHAGLKFLKSAYLLECCIIPTSRASNAPRVLHIYNDAANLFKYCAETNAKNGNTVVAALAYKCMEVAYLRVAFGLKHVCSSSQSILYKGDSGMLWNIGPKNDNAFLLKQLLSISACATTAMDATMRSHRALELAIKHHSCTRGHGTGGLSLVRKALDFSFYDVEEFVHLIISSLKDVEM